MSRPTMPLRLRTAAALVRTLALGLAMALPGLATAEMAPPRTESLPDS